MNVNKIKIDGREVLQSISAQEHKSIRRYIKLGEVRLEAGKHRIMAISKWQMANSKKQDLKLILVDKKEREKVEKEIWQRINQPGAELCYIFSKGKGEFYIP